MLKLWHRCALLQYLFEICWGRVFTQPLSPSQTSHLGTLAYSVRGNLLGILWFNGSGYPVRQLGYPARRFGSPPPIGSGYLDNQLGYLSPLASSGCLILHLGSDCRSHR
ncbi:unnamed protein product [Arabidopsis halleri]